MTRMSDNEIQAALASIPDWTVINGELQQTFQFDTFMRAIRFVNRLAEAAELANHHPDILIRYNKVTVTISTHDAGGITSKDFALASEAEALAKS